MQENKDQEGLEAKVKDILSSDLDEAEKIRQLFALGFSRRQLEKELGFPKATVYTTLPVKPESEPPSSKATQPTKGHDLMKIGAKDIIPPEQALRDIRLQDGEYKLGFVDGMGVLIMAARYNQILAASQAEVLSNQLRIMEESRKGSAEIAQEAAARAAALVGAQILPRIDQMSAQVAGGGENPMAGLMMTLMQPAFQQAAAQLAKLFGTTQRPDTPGEQTQEQTQEQQPAQEQPAQKQPAQEHSQGWNPPNIRQRDISEWEED